MLDASDQVGDKLVDGALVLDRAGHTLSHLHLVPLTVEINTQSQITANRQHTHTFSPSHLWPLPYYWKYTRHTVSLFLPEVAFLTAAVLLHGVQGAHPTVLLQPHAI